MSKHINLRRLTLALQELWFMNKMKLVTIPIVVLLLLTMYYLWYGTPLAQHLLFNQYPSQESFIADLVQYRRMESRITILFLVGALYIIICSSTYLTKLNSSIWATTLPFSRGERITALILLNIAIVGLVTISFATVDALFVSVLKRHYLEQSLAYLENNGYLYYEFAKGSYFTCISGEIYYLSLLFWIGAVPLYHLSMVFFKKHSCLKFNLLLVVCIIVAVRLISYLHDSMNENSIRTHIGSTGSYVALGIFGIIILGLIITTTYFKLKEKEY